jgi:DnaJ-class molecular chaperone
LSEIPDEIPLNISLAESIEGTVKELQLPIKVSCEKCRQKGILPANRIDGACKACNGTGVQTLKSESAEIQIQCKFCKGSKIGFRTLCPDCDGKGYVFQRRKITVNIPTMVEDGQLVTVKHPTRKRDLVVKLSVDRHSEFERRGFDLHSTIEISFTQSILGGATVVQGLREQLYVEIPPGSQPDTTVGLTGKGIRKFNSTKCGDHVVHLRVKLPVKLSARQRQLIEQFAETEGEVFSKQIKTDRLKNVLEKRHQNQQHEQY